MEFSPRAIGLKARDAVYNNPVPSLIGAGSALLFWFGQSALIEDLDAKMTAWLGDDWPSVVMASPFFKGALLLIIGACLWQIGIGAKRAERAAAASERDAIDRALAPLAADIERYNRLRNIDRAKLHLAACSQAVDQADNNLELLERQGQIEFGFNSEFGWKEPWGVATERGRLASDCLRLDNLEFPVLASPNWIEQPHHRDPNLKVVIADQNGAYLASKRADNGRIRGFVADAARRADEELEKLLERDPRWDR